MEVYKGIQNNTYYIPLNFFITPYKGIGLVKECNNNKKSIRTFYI